MFKRILFPTDFSDPSMKVLDYIPALRGAGTKEGLVLVHVHPTGKMSALVAFGGTGIPSGPVPDQETETQRRLRGGDPAYQVIDIRRGHSRKQGVWR